MSKKKREGKKSKEICLNLRIIRVKRFFFFFQFRSIKRKKIQENLNYKKDFLHIPRGIKTKDKIYINHLKVADMSQRAGLAAY